MGFEEAARSSLESNRKLRSRRKRGFKSSQMVSPPFHTLNDGEDEEFERRMIQAEQSMRRRVNKTYLISVVVAILGVLILAALLRNL